MNAEKAIQPKRSAAIILLKEDAEGLKVFLVKRMERQTFMAGSYVFPGGITDIQDKDQKTFARCRGVVPSRAKEILGKTLSEEESLAFWVTGVRELFEEAGVLFAADRTGETVADEDTPVQERFNNYRRLLQRGKMTLVHLAEKEGLVYTLDQFVHFAHWITPEGRPVRFYTHFFIAAMPENQSASADGEETTDGRWIAPRDALEENLNGTMILMPPTIATLEDLARFERIDEVLLSLKDRETSGPIQPVYVDVPDRPFVTFPWDPDFEQYKKGDIPGIIDHGRPSTPSDSSTRIVYENGLNVPYCKTRIS
jgi:8-oxo-dGTP pyrophosphatase MutT (NUDIX family)